MNVIEYKSKNKPIVFCFIDNTYQYDSAWTTELIKNIADYSISNIFSKGYDILQSQSEDDALQTAVDRGYKHAVVFSTGTEFINGREFFNEIEKLTKTEYSIYGHILDRKQSYYELHHQCYLINLDIYKSLNCPEVGQVTIGVCYQEFSPDRSNENIHDDYTPLWVSKGNSLKEYTHKLHGWNIISTYLNAEYTITAFDNKIRQNKKHYYPENQQEFLKHISWSYKRHSYCANEFVHTDGTDNIIVSKKYRRIITPSSSLWCLDYLDTTYPATVIFYDYNQAALDYWKDAAPARNNVTYDFVKINLLEQSNICQLIKNEEVDTLLNLSNIFCYEGTAMFSSLEYRLHKENEIINSIPKDWTVVYSERSTTGFTDECKDVKLNKLKKPTWHFGNDWN